MGDRIAGIDRFRGTAIVLMVFFTLILALSDSLPDALRHNVEGAVHAGDFVLPMFLFASGMSLVFFHRKRAGKKGYLLDVIERFGGLTLVWLFLAPFSAGGFLQMDELMLNILLAIPTLALLAFPDAVIAIAAAIPVLSYLALMWAHALPDFSAAYLGGYPAAFFYLPVMLAGAIAGRRLKEAGRLLAVVAVVAALLLILVPPYKLSASPSFMALSAAFSLVAYMALERFHPAFMAPLEYLGRKPLRFWILMWLAILIPLAVYVMATASYFPLQFGWEAAVVLSLCALVALALLSAAIDRAAALMAQRAGGGTARGGK